nr:immunoglobulin heavy chain junction region [Mus musculus]
CAREGYYDYEGFDYW